MTEENVKKRGWVKTAVIIFLSILLVLTFFSNTFMNRSLPEVAAVYAAPGSITAQIRGSGIVTAVESYSVKTNQSRTVQTVLVKVGDTVNVGDTLMILKAGDSVELEQAKEALASAELAYERAVLQMDKIDYTQTNKEIQRFKEDLNELIAQRDACVVSDADISSAQYDLNALKKEITSATNELTDIQEEIAQLPGGSAVSAEDASAALDQAEIDLKAAVLLYGDQCDIFKAIAMCRFESNSSEAKQSALYQEFSGKDYMGYFITTVKREGEVEVNVISVGGKYGDLYLYDSSVTAPLGAYYCNDLAYAYNSIYTAQNAYDEAHQAYIEAVSSDSSRERERLTALQRQLQTELDTLNQRYETAQAELTDLESRQSRYSELDTQVKNNQRTLEDMLYNLSKTQQNDSMQQQLENLNLNELRKEIDRQKEKVAELSGEGSDSELISDVSGTVTSINISAGNTTAYDETLMTIEVKDRGYTLSFPVTNEQAQKVRIGDTANISNYWWGSPITAVLAGISNDPQNPGQSKLLVFSISGDVETGTNLSLSIGQRSAEYETVVPNSAVRSDSNGDFVLVVEAKSTALGNRYTAKRVDVTVLAKDDINTAVSGNIESYAFVITTSAKPIESGMLVRLPDNM